MRSGASVLVVDDHPVLAESLALVLSGDPRYGEVAVAGSLAGARALLARGWERALVDVRLPDGPGTELVAELVAARPGCRVVALTAEPRPVVVNRALASGAVAVLAKGTGLGSLLRALEEAVPEPGAVVAEVLSPRELDVLRQLVAGVDVRGTARRLGISPHTVRDHLKSVFGKLGVPGQLGAVVAAHRMGLLDLDEPLVGTG